MKLITLFLLMAFASVNAVLFTPALPNIAHFFEISTTIAQQTVSVFLIGYTFGQLLYSPFANRFGRKHALYSGIILQILSALLCVLAGILHLYSLLIVGRFFLALGSGVGLSMSFTLVHEYYPPEETSQKTAYLVSSFAIMPGLSITLGGFLNEHYGWTSCFYASALYGVLLLFLLTTLPETKKQVDTQALKIKHLLQGYSAQFKNPTCLAGGILWGTCTACIYGFAAMAPFIAINRLGMNSSEYGLANLLPPLGLIGGSIYAHYFKSNTWLDTIRLGIGITTVGVVWMLLAALLAAPAFIALFLPMMLLYFGTSLIMTNASTVAMSRVNDRAYGSAVMSFLNMGFAALLVCAVALFPSYAIVLPVFFLVLIGMMVGITYTLVGFESSAFKSNGYKMLSVNDQSNADFT